MREFDPLDQNPDGMMKREPIYGDSDSGLATFGVFIALAVVVGVGAYVFSKSDNNQQVALNNPPAVTAPATPDSGKTDSR